MEVIDGKEFARMFFEMRDQRDAAVARAEAAEAEVWRLLDELSSAADGHDRPLSSH
jgi:hypothetical protein